MLFYVKKKSTNDSSRKYKIEWKANTNETMFGIVLSFLLH